MMTEKVLGWWWAKYQGIRAPSSYGVAVMTGVTYSPFWGDNQNAYTLLRNTAPQLDRIRRVANKEGNRVNKALLAALIGAASGGTATGTHVRIIAGNFGHSIRKESVETITDISRATTAADITALKAYLSAVSVMPSTFPADKSGNGGPALTPSGGI